MSVSGLFQASPVADLFSGLSRETITNILAAGTVRTFAAGRIIIRTGELARRLFLIKAGSVNYCRVTSEGREILLRRLAPGEAFGLGTLLPNPIGYIGTADAVRESEIWTWEHLWIQRFVEKQPKLAENALRIALEYIRLYSERHLSIVSDSAEHRLAQTLITLGIRTGHHTLNGLEVQITNQHLASLADVGPYTASRFLSKWERKGAVEKSRGKVVIRCPERMLI
jgi:CRP-like cAMP-binding protein